MSAVTPLPSLRRRQERKLEMTEEGQEEGIDLDEVPDDLVAIGSHDLIVAWLLKERMRDGDDEEPPGSH